MLDPLEKIVEEMTEYQPDVVAAPPSILLHMKGIYPKKLLSIAEVLDPLDAERLEKQFEQPIHQI